MHALLQTALSHHQANRLDEAEEFYRAVLSADPGEADALHLLGVVAHQRGQHARAVELIGQALRVRPETAAFHLSIGEAYRAAGNLASAAEHGRYAVRLQPQNAGAHNNLGLALQQQGNADEAFVHFKVALEQRPQWPAPYLNVGQLLRDRGRRDEAVTAYREGVRLCPDSPHLHDALGQLLLQLGQADDAMLQCQEAVRLGPGWPEALVHLGEALAALGRRDEARSCYLRAAELAPGLALPRYRLGRLLQAEGQLEESVTWFEQAIRLEPHNAAPYCGLGASLFVQDRPEEAVAAYRRALEIEPRNSEALNSLGYVLQNQGQMQEALAAYRAAVAARPDYADAFLNQGLLFSEMGEMGQALASLREALRHDPYHLEALGALAMALRDRFPAADLAAAERVLAHPRVAGQRRAVLQYGLVQVMDARGQYGQAAEYARQANDYCKGAARHRGQVYDPDAHALHVDQLIRVFSSAHFERVRGWGLETEVPVFVVGLPRSGTSLTEQILASHSHTHGAGELVFIRAAYRGIPALVGKQAPAVECVDQLGPAHVQLLASEYFDRVHRLAPEADRIVDKLPDNYLMLGLIATLFPRARVIHMRRDLRDLGLSCWLTHFRSLRWAYDLEDIGTRIQQYLRLMKHWRQALPLPMLEVDYEEIVADLEPAARKLVAWCGLEWDTACLAFHQTKRVVRTASMTQVREPLYARSVGRWRHYHDVLGPLLRLLPQQS
jgi:tetratricopeptide (TPR) repeat protein